MITHYLTSVILILMQKCDSVIELTRAQTLPLAYEPDQNVVTVLTSLLLDATTIQCPRILKEEICQSALLHPHYLDWGRIRDLLFDALSLSPYHTRLHPQPFAYQFPQTLRQSAHIPNRFLTTRTNVCINIQYNIFNNNIVIDI